MILVPTDKPSIPPKPGLGNLWGLDDRHLAQIDFYPVTSVPNRLTNSSSLLECNDSIFGAAHGS